MCVCRFFFINTSLSLNNPMSLAGYWRLICPAFLFKSTLLDWLIKWLSLDRPSNVVIRRTNRWNRPSSTCSYGKLLDFDDCVFLSCCCLVFICLTARSFFGRRRWRPWQQSAFDHQSNSWSKIQRYGRRVFTLSLGAGVRKNCCRLDKTREMGEGGHLERLTRHRPFSVRQSRVLLNRVGKNWSTGAAHCLQVQWKPKHSGQPGSRAAPQVMTGFVLRTDWATDILGDLTSLKTKHRAARNPPALLRRTEAPLSLFQSVCLSLGPCVGLCGSLSLSLSLSQAHNWLPYHLKTQR